MDVDGPYLYATKQGYVLRCACCGRLEVCFRNLLLSANEEQFCSLQEIVSRMCQVSGAHPCPHLWNVACVSGAGSSKALLDAGDIREMDELLKGASAIIELEAMLDATLGPAWRHAQSER